MTNFFPEDGSIASPQDYFAIGFYVRLENYTDTYTHPLRHMLEILSTNGNWSRIENFGEGAFSFTKIGNNQYSESVPTDALYGKWTKLVFVRESASVGTATYVDENKINGQVPYDFFDALADT